MSMPLVQESHSSHARQQPHQHAGASSASQAPDLASQEGVERAFDGGEDGGARAAHTSPSASSRGREIWGDNWIRGGLLEGVEDVKQGGSMLEGEADAAAALARARSASASSPGLPPPPIPQVLTDGEGEVARARDGASAQCEQSRDVQEDAFGYHVHSRSRVVDLYGTAPRGELSRSRRDSAPAVSLGWRAGGMPWLWNKARVRRPWLPTACSQHTEIYCDCWTLSPSPSSQSTIPAPLMPPLSLYMHIRIRGALCPDYTFVRALGPARA